MESALAHKREKRAMKTVKHGDTGGRTSFQKNMISYILWSNLVEFVINTIQLLYTIAYEIIIRIHGENILNDQMAKVYCVKAILWKYGDVKFLIKKNLNYILIDINYIVRKFFLIKFFVVYNWIKCAQ